MNSIKFEAKLTWRNRMKRTIAVILISLAVSVQADDGLKKDLKKTGHDTKTALKQTGHAIKRGGKKIGHGVRDASKEIGHGFKNAAKKIKEDSH
jgi:hypothetical protein